MSSFGYEMQIGLLVRQTLDFSRTDTSRLHVSLLGRAWQDRRNSDQNVHGDGFSASHGGLELPFPKCQAGRLIHCWHHPLEYLKARYAPVGEQCSAKNYELGTLFDWNRHPLEI